MYYTYYVNIKDKKHINNIDAEMKMFNHNISFYKNEINKKIYQSMLKFSSLNIKENEPDLYASLKNYPYIIMRKGNNPLNYTFLIHKDYYRISKEYLFQVLLKISTQYKCVVSIQKEHNSFHYELKEDHITKIKTLSAALGGE